MEQCGEFTRKGILPREEWKLMYKSCDWHEFVHKQMIFTLYTGD